MLHKGIANRSLRHTTHEIFKMLNKYQDDEECYSIEESAKLWDEHVKYLEELDEK